MFFCRAWRFLHQPGILLLLCLLTACSSSKVIVNGLQEREANEIIVLLADKGITANKIPAVAAATAGAGGVPLYDISVPDEQAIEAMGILNANGLPRKQSQNLLQLFQKSGLVPSQMEERIRYRAGLAEQIASTIRKMPGVVDADVQLSFPEEDPLNPGKKLGKIAASVYVKFTGVGDNPNVHLDSKIKRLVSGSIDGLTFDDVTVVTDRARLGELPGLTTGEVPKDYVSVWTVIIAKESLTRFRIIFFTMLSITFLAILFILWTVWKFMPLIRSVGLRSYFLSFAPISASGIEKKEEKKEEEAPKSEGDENLFDDEEGDSKKNKEVT